MNPPRPLRLLVVQVLPVCSAVDRVSMKNLMQLAALSVAPYLQAG